MAAWSTISDIREHYRVPDGAWQKFAAALGDADLNEMLMLAGVDDSDYIATRDCCGCSPLHKSSLNLLFCAIKHKFGMRTAVLQFQAEPATTWAILENKSAEGGNDGVVAVLHTKVKLSQIINQGIDQDVPMMNEEGLMVLRKKYIEVSGDEPLATIDASDAQLTALQFVVSNGLAPYTDFAVWGPHGARQERRMRFAQNFMDTSGKWRAVEQGGPANLEVWRS